MRSCWQGEALPRRWGPVHHQPLGGTAWFPSAFRLPPSSEGVTAQHGRARAREVLRKVLLTAGADAEVHACGLYEPAKKAMTVPSISANPPTGSPPRHADGGSSASHARFSDPTWRLRRSRSLGAGIEHNVTTSP